MSPPNDKDLAVCINDIVGSVSESSVYKLNLKLLTYKVIAEPIDSALSVSCFRKDCRYNILVHPKEAMAVRLCTYPLLNRIYGKKMD